MGIDGIEAFTVTTSSSGWQKHAFRVNGRDTYVIPVEMENRFELTEKGKRRCGPRSLLVMSKH